MDYKKLIVIAVTIAIILVGLKKRSENHGVPVIEQPRVVQKTEILTEEEIAQVKAQQELLLKEAESLKIKDQLLEEKKRAVEEYDTKLAQVETELSKIRSGKLSFTFSPKLAALPGPSIKQNAEIQVSVLTLEDLERLGIGNFYPQPTVLTVER